MDWNEDEDDLESSFGQKPESERQRCLTQKEKSDSLQLDNLVLSQMIKLQNECNYRLTVSQLQTPGRNVINKLGAVQIIEKLIQFYAQCLSEAEKNVQLITSYFRLKMKEMSNHYQWLVKHKPTSVDPIALGAIDGSVRGLQFIKNSLKDQSTVQGMRISMTHNVLAILQLQDIQGLIIESNRKAQKRNICLENSLLQQQVFLEQRRNNSKHNLAKALTKSSISTSFSPRNTERSLSSFSSEEKLQT